MGLADRLGARAALRGRSAPVECGGLGTLTVEALPVRELELLLRGPDGARAVFYAACRELQQAGEELRRAGRVFTPDGVMQFVSGQEAQAALRTVLELSGQTDGILPLIRPDTESVSPTDENRREIVQLNKAPERAEIPARQSENRLASVQKSDSAAAPSVPTAEEFRLEPVQKTDAPAPGIGQVSRETEPLTAEFDRIPKPDKKTQAMGISAFERTQNVVSGFDGGLLSPSRTDGLETALHESKSEFQEEAPEPLHEIVSDFGETLHEIESELRKAVHETTSDFPELTEGTAHEAESELREAAHEIKSDFPGLTEGTVREPEPELREAVHETTSDFPGLTEGTVREPEPELREAAHETTSDFPGLTEGTVREPEPELRDGAHEIESDFPGLTEGTVREPEPELREAAHVTESECPEALHEITSEFAGVRDAERRETPQETAERTARLLLEGLRRAKWVRGD